MTITGSHNGYYNKLHEGLLSLASDNANDDLLPKAFSATHFFYVDFNPHVFDHLFFDDGGKPSAFPVFKRPIAQSRAEASTTKDKHFVMD